MHSVATTLAAVEHELACRNGEVIGRAFKDASVSCVVCEYPENVEDFSFWLEHHIRDKLDLHRKNRKYNLHYEHCERYRCSWSGCEACKCLRHSAYKARIEAEQSRRMLKQMWPCPTCITLYNPTARINHVLRNRPVPEGFLDVRFD